MILRSLDVPASGAKALDSLLSPNIYYRCRESALNALIASCSFDFRRIGLLNCYFLWLADRLSCGLAVFGVMNMDPFGLVLFFDSLCSYWSFTTTPTASHIISYVYRLLNSLD